MDEYGWIYMGELTNSIGWPNAFKYNKVMRAHLIFLCFDIVYIHILNWQISHLFSIKLLIEWAKLEWERLAQRVLNN